MAHLFDMSDDELITIPKIPKTNNKRPAPAPSVSDEEIEITPPSAKKLAATSTLVAAVATTGAITAADVQNALLRGHFTTEEMREMTKTLNYVFKQSIANESKKQKRVLKVGQNVALTLDCRVGPKGTIGRLTEVRQTKCSVVFNGLSWTVSMSMIAPVSK